MKEGRNRRPGLLSLIRFLVWKWTMRIEAIEDGIEQRSMTAMRAITTLAIVAALVVGAGAANAKAIGEVGWVKADDVTCDQQDHCYFKNNYTRKDCGSFNIPVYAKPNEKPIGLLVNDQTVEDTFIRDESKDGYIWLRYAPSPGHYGLNTQSPNPSYPLKKYNSKSLHSCLGFDLH
jgi:hypothetical protein